MRHAKTYDENPGGGATGPLPAMTAAGLGTQSEAPLRAPQRLILHVLAVVALVWLLFGVFFGLMTCPTPDMYPRIDQGDLLLYYRLDKDVLAQDVVVVRKNDTTYVGRVVAVAGDTVDITNADELVVNGSLAFESNIFYGTPRYEGFVEYPLTLGEGQCFVLADRRLGGEDSRYFGPVEAGEIRGTVITILRRNSL